MKNSEKTYICFCQEQEDEPPVIRRLNGEQIRARCKQGWQGDIAIVDGNLVKGWENKIDLKRL